MKRDEWNAGKINAFSASYWSGCALHAGVSLGVTAELAQAPATAGDLAQKLGLDLRGLKMLLTALCALGFLRLNGEAYSMASSAKPFLSPGGDRDMSGIILHHANLMKNWARLAKSVQSGKPVADPRSREESANFYRGMRDLARQQASGLAQRLGLKAGQRVLDLGGGPGVYGYTFADETPGLMVTVFDLPASEELFIEEGRAHPRAAEVRRLNGSYRDSDLGAPYEAVWISQVLHGEGPGVCQELVDKAAGALTPGGVLWIQEFVVDYQGQGHPFPALFALNMLVQTKDGQSYSADEISGFMGLAGLRDMEYVGPTVPGSPASLVKGVKP